MALMLAVMGLRPTADYTWSSQRFQPVHEELGAYQRGGEGSDAERIGKIKRHFCAASVGALPWSPQRHPLADPPQRRRGQGKQSRVGCERGPFGLFSQPPSEPDLILVASSGSPVSLFL